MHRQMPSPDRQKTFTLEHPVEGIELVHGPQAHDMQDKNFQINHVTQ